MARPEFHWNDLDVGDVMVPVKEHRCSWAPGIHWKVVSVDHKSPTQAHGTLYTVIAYSAQGTAIGKFDYSAFTERHEPVDWARGEL